MKTCWAGNFVFWTNFAKHKMRHMQDKYKQALAFSSNDIYLNILKEEYFKVFLINCEKL